MSEIEFERERLSRVFFSQVAQKSLPFLQFYRSLFTDFNKGVALKKKT